MISAKLILLTGILMLLAFYLIKVRSKILDRIFFIGLLLMGMVLVLYPDITSKLAKFIGIGRGADLIFYLAILFFLFCFLLSYGKIKELEKNMTEFIRNDAIDNASENL
ncbi:MAG: DUF2304 domain-containing protein [Chitinophagaceae bacterium]